MTDVIVRGSHSNPPPFQWDHWYQSIGGRKISIPEVDEILKKIHEEQYPRFDGPVNSVKKQFQNSKVAAETIKAKAKELGADIVGICLIEPSDIYKGKNVTEKFAIAVGQRMLYRHFQNMPSQESAVECLRVYHTLGETVIALANFIRSLGFACKVEHPIGDSDILHVPIGLKAGFGELGRHGSIIHPTLGPLFRMGSVITDIEMECDQPIDAGIAAFCDNCKACRNYCPANAVPEERSPEAGKDHLGNDRFLIDTGKCFPYFANHYYCSACLPVCVYNRKEWAKDFEGFKTLNFPNIVFEDAPNPTDDVPTELKHLYPRVNRNVIREVPKNNSVNRRKKG